MKKKSLIVILYLSLFSPIFAQDFDLSFLTIPDSLKTHANAVIRNENTSIEIISQAKMIIRKEVIITILNKLGKDKSYIQLDYDKHTKINNVSVHIYDALGQEIKKIKQNDFKDVSAVGNGNLYSDNRILYYEYIPVNYPYTIKYEYKITTSNTAFIPDWLPIKYYYTSTQKSIFTLTHPTDIKVYLKEQNLDGYQIKNNPKNNIISYTLKNAKAIEHENLSPIFYDYGPHVKFAINKFHLAGVDGQAENWKEFGKWINDKLLIGRNELPENIKLEIHSLVKETDDKKERARLVYEYMQNKTRYISVQIGIGGWKPMLANEVDKLGYGDCKALTNYTQALLEEADVNSYYTVIYAKRRRNIDNELAAMQGNHAILMVPTKKDTIWLECTSQKSPFGHLGKFTDDRDALVITPEGGKIIHTKKYTNTESKQIINGEYTINQNGNISASAKIKSSGIQYDNHFSIADYDSKEKDTYYKAFFSNINNIKIEKTSCKNDNLNIEFNEEIKFTASNYAVNSGDRMLVRLNAFNVNQNIPKRYRNRKLPLEIQYGFLDIDEVIINLPENYKVESMANNKELTTKFGLYKIEIQTINEQQIKYSRKFLINQGLYTIEDYEKYRKFRKKVNQLDNSKIVLIKT